MTYIMLNLAYLLIIVGCILALGVHHGLQRKPLLLTLAIVLLATLIFDNVIIGLGLVTYDTTKILGLYLGRAPIEDFAYALAAVLVVPVLWKVNGSRHE